MLKKGMCVRVPIIVESADMRYPRVFALAQVERVDELADVVFVRINDLFHCKQYYPEVFEIDRMPISKVFRVRIPTGCQVMTPRGLGEVLTTTKIKDEEFYTYFVRLAQVETASFSENQLICDFSAFAMDPLEMLGRYEFQNPSWFASRYVVSATMHTLENAVYGFRILAGCRVFMLPHQITTVVRCMQSNPIRFMLADEVGLGKTIEACAIVKIMQSRNPSLRALYVLPAQLMDQWKFELDSKFYIDAVTYRHSAAKDRHVMISTQELKRLPDPLVLRGFDILIVDETHNILSDDGLYQLVRSLSEAMENVLLLSATPISDRRAEYLNLLRLLEPQRYGLMTEEEFGRLVGKQRQLEQDLFTLLSDINDYQEFADSIIRKLQSMAENLEDAMLSKMVSQIDGSVADAGQDEVKGIAAYICEQYRLEKNVIRNRRALIHEQMSVRRMVEVPYAMAGAQEAYYEDGVIDVLMDWLSESGDGTISYVERIVRPILSSAFSSVWALSAVLHRLSEEGTIIPGSLWESVERWRAAAEMEIESVDELLDERPDLIHGRLVHVMDYLEQETELLGKEPYKIVLFTDNVQTLQVFSMIAQRRLKKYRHTTFCQGMPAEALERSVEEFQSDPDCRIMICDILGGEGRNFQQADIIVHLDTPWSAIRLEQRIGRLDRLGRDADADVVSVVFYAEGSMEEQLVHLWRDGLGLYTQSLSGFEIITGELEREILCAVSQDIRTGLRNAIPQIQAQTELMRETVQEEQFYDMTAMLFRPLSATVARMLDLYQGKEDEIFSSAMISWASQAGVVPNSYLDKNGMTVTEFSANMFSPASSENAFLIPPKWDRYSIERLSLTSARRSLVGTFNRAYAIRREDLMFFAPGDPVFESITRNAITCYRGRVCALEMAGAPVDYAGLVLIWNVEPNMNYLYANGVDPIMMARFRAFLPMEQIVTLYPEDERHAGVKAEQIETILRDRHRIRACNHLGRRSGSSKGNAEIDEFIHSHPPADWKKWLSKAREACRETAEGIVRERWDYGTALEEAQRMVHAQDAVDHYFGMMAKRESETSLKYKAVLVALNKFRVVLDAAIYLRMQTNGTD